MVEILVTAIGASVVTLIGNIVMFIMQRKASKIDKQDLKLKEQVEEIKKENQKQNADNLLLKNGVLALLKDRLFQSCQYYLNKGSISVDEMEVVELMYKNYHALGANGVGQKLFEAVEKMFKETRSN